jgi:hypothetical protein
MMPIGGIRLASTEKSGWPGNKVEARRVNQRDPHGLILERSI